MERARSRKLMAICMRRSEGSLWRPWHSHFSGSIAEQSDGEYGGATGIITNSASAFFQDGDRGGLVAWVPHDGPHVANARLIAAAPELLQHLRECFQMLEDYYDAISMDGDEWAILASTRAVIAKAEGRTNED
jgi:hypothetical protein